MGDDEDAPPVTGKLKPTEKAPEVSDRVLPCNLYGRTPTIQPRWPTRNEYFSYGSASATDLGYTCVGVTP